MGKEDGWFVRCGLGGEGFAWELFPVLLPSVGVCGRIFLACFLEGGRSGSCFLLYGFAERVYGHQKFTVMEEGFVRIKGWLPRNKKRCTMIRALYT